MKVQPFDKVIIKANGFTYIADRVIGNGSFGVVVRATVQEREGELVAIKKVLQDKRYKVGPSFISSSRVWSSLYSFYLIQNRELQIMQMLSHPNIVELKNSFYTNGDKVRTHYPQTLNSNSNFFIHFNISS